MTEPLFSDPTPDPLASALHKLKWARDGEWSVPLTPGECGAVLDALEAKQELEAGDGRAVRVEAGHMRRYGFRFSPVDPSEDTNYLRRYFQVDAPNRELAIQEAKRRLIEECHRNPDDYALAIESDEPMPFTTSLLADVVVSSSQTGVDATRPGPH